MQNSLQQQLTEIVGADYVVTEPTALAPFLQEPRGKYHGQALCVLQPQNVQQISKIMALAHEKHLAVVPQGGNTGLVGGSQPQDGQSLLLSLSHLKQIRKIDILNQLVVVEAGVVLDQLQQLLQAEEYFFPLHLASSGSCEIGGLLSTNAGGMHVLSYGTMRDLCLGLEIVLPNGEILFDLRYVRKDNSGYDLKDLFIGAEGTLGVITAASLKIYPKPQFSHLVYMGVSSLQEVQKLFVLARQLCGEFLRAFELISDIGIDLVLNFQKHLVSPLQKPSQWYVLLELSTSISQNILQDVLENFIRQALKKKYIEDAVLAQNSQQQKIFWQLRENLSPAQKYAGASIKHDISVPLSVLPEFVQQADILIHQLLPAARIVCFGHIGDGNLHYNILQAPQDDRDEFLAHWDEVNEKIHALAVKMGGSFSAEHGIGQMKRRELQQLKSPEAYALMKKIKKTLDPQNLMNPGKLFF